ncbi:hypothetical protein ACFL2I_03375, partial [Candidatus Omnitrophota bacterium]
MEQDKPDVHNSYRKHDLFEGYNQIKPVEPEEIAQAHASAEAGPGAKKSRTEREAAYGQLSLWFDYSSKPWLKFVACVVIAAFLHQDIVWAAGPGFTNDIKQMLQEPAQKTMDRLGSLFSIKNAYAQGALPDSSMGDLPPAYTDAVNQLNNGGDPFAGMCDPYYWDSFIDYGTDDYMNDIDKFQVDPVELQNSTIDINKQIQIDEVYRTDPDDYFQDPITREWDYKPGGMGGPGLGDQGQWANDAIYNITDSITNVDYTTQPLYTTGLNFDDFAVNVADDWLSNPLDTVGSDNWNYNLPTVVTNNDYITNYSQPSIVPFNLEDTYKPGGVSADMSHVRIDTGDWRPTQDLLSSGQVQQFDPTDYQQSLKLLSDSTPAYFADDPTKAYTWSGTGTPPWESDIFKPDKGIGITAQGLQNYTSPYAGNFDSKDWHSPDQLNFQAEYTNDAHMFIRVNGELTNNKDYIINNIDRSPADALVHYKLSSYHPVLGGLWDRYATITEITAQERNELGWAGRIVLSRPADPAEGSSAFPVPTAGDPAWVKFSGYHDRSIPTLFRDIDIHSVNNTPLIPFRIDPGAQINAGRSLGRLDVYITKGDKFNASEIPQGAKYTFPTETLYSSGGLESTFFNHAIVREGNNITHKGRFINFNDPSQRFTFDTDFFSNQLAGAARGRGGTDSLLNFSSRFHGFNLDAQRFVAELNKGDSIQFSSNKVLLGDTVKNTNYDLRILPGDTAYGIGGDTIYNVGATSAARRAVYSVEPKTETYEFTISSKGIFDPFASSSGHGSIRNVRNLELAIGKWTGSSKDTPLTVTLADKTREQFFRPHGRIDEIMRGSLPKKFDTKTPLSEDSYQRNILKFGKTPHIEIGAHSVSWKNFTGNFSRTRYEDKTETYQAMGRIDGVNPGLTGEDLNRVNPNLSIPYLKGSNRVQDGFVRTYDDFNSEWHGGFLGKNFSPGSSGLDSVVSLSLASGNTSLNGQLAKSERGRYGRHHNTNSMFFEGKTINLDSISKMTQNMQNVAMGQTLDKALSLGRGPGSFKIESIYKDGDAHQQWKLDKFANRSIFRMENDHDNIPIVADMLSITQGTEMRYGQTGAPHPLNGWWVKASPGHQTGSVKYAKTSDFDQWNNLGIKTAVIDDVRFKGVNDLGVVRAVKTAIEFDDQHMLEWGKKGSAEGWQIHGVEKYQSAASLIDQHKIRLLTAEDIGADAPLLNKVFTMEAAGVGSADPQFSGLKIANLGPGSLGVAQDFNPGQSPVDYQLELKATGQFYHQREFTNISPQQRAMLEEQSLSGTTIGDPNSGEYMAVNLADQSRAGQSTMMGSSTLDGSSTNIKLYNAPLGNLFAEGDIGYILSGKRLGIYENLGWGARGRFMEDLGQITTISPGTQNFNQEGKPYEVRKYEVWNIEAEKDTQFAFGGEQRGQLGGVRIGQPYEINDQVLPEDRLVRPSVTGTGKIHYNSWDKDNNFRARAVAGIEFADIAIDTAQRDNELRFYATATEAANADMASALFNQDLTKSIAAPAHAATVEIGKIDEQIREFAFDWSGSRFMEKSPDIINSTEEIDPQTIEPIKLLTSDNIIHYDAREYIGSDNPIAFALGAGDWRARTQDNLTMLYQDNQPWNERQWTLLADVFDTKLAKLDQFLVPAMDLVNGQFDLDREIASKAMLENYQPGNQPHIFVGQDGLAKIGNNTKMWLESPDITFNFKTLTPEGTEVAKRELRGFRLLNDAAQLSEQMRPFMEKFSQYQPDQRGKFIRFENDFKVYGEFAQEQVATRMAQDFGRDLERVNSENIQALIDDLVDIGKSFNIPKIETRVQEISTAFSESEYQDRQQLATDIFSLFNDVPDLSIKYEESEKLDSITRQAAVIRDDVEQVIFNQTSKAEYSHSDKQLKIPADNDFLDFAFSISSGGKEGQLGTARTDVSILGTDQRDDKFFSLFNSDTAINALAMGDVFAKTNTWVFDEQGGNLAVGELPIRRYFADQGEREIKLAQNDQGLNISFDPGLRQELVFNEPAAAMSLASDAEFMLVYGEGSQWEARQDAQGNTFFAGLNLKDDPGKYVKFGDLHGVKDLQNKPDTTHSFDSDVVTWNEQQQALNFRFTNPEFNQDAPATSPMFKVDLAQLNSSDQRNTGSDPLKTTIERDTLTQARLDYAHNIFHNLDPATKTEHTLGNRKYDQYTASIEAYGLSMTPFSDTAFPSANIEPTYVGFGGGYEARVAKAGRPQEGLDLLVNKFKFQDYGDHLSHFFGNGSVPMQMNGLEMFQGAYYYQQGELAIEAGTSSPGQIQQGIEGVFRSVRQTIEERPLIFRQQTPDGRILEIKQPGTGPLQPNVKVTDLYARFSVAKQHDGSLEYFYRRGTAMSVWDKLFPNHPMAAEVWSNISRDLSDAIIGERGTRALVEAVGLTVSEPLQKAEIRSSYRHPGIGPDGFGKVFLDYQFNRTDTDEGISVDLKLHKANEIQLSSESASMLSGLLDRAPEETYIVTPQYELRRDPIGSEVAGLTIDDHKFSGEDPSILFFAIEAEQKPAITPVTVKLNHEPELDITLNALKIPLANGKEAAMGALAGQVPWKGETSVDGLTIHLEDQAITVYGGWKLYADNNIEVYRAGQDKFLEETWSNKNAGGAGNLSGTLAQLAMQSFPGRGVGVENVEWGKGEETVEAYRYSVFDGYNSAQGPLIAGSPLLAPGSEFSPAEAGVWLDFAGDEFKRLEHGRYSAEAIDSWRVDQPYLLGQANQDGARKIFDQSGDFSGIEFDVTDPMIQIADTAHNYNVRAGIVQDNMNISRYNTAGPMLLHKQAQFDGPVLFFAENNFAGLNLDGGLTTFQGSTSSFDLTELIAKVEQRSIAQGLPFDREAFVNTIGREGVFNLAKGFNLPSYSNIPVREIKLRSAIDSYRILCEPTVDTLKVLKEVTSFREDFNLARPVTIFNHDAQSGYNYPALVPQTQIAQAGNNLLFLTDTYSTKTERIGAASANLNRYHGNVETMAFDPTPLIHHVGARADFTGEIDFYDTQGLHPGTWNRSTSANKDAVPVAFDTGRVRVGLQQLELDFGTFARMGFEIPIERDGQTIDFSSDQASVGIVGDNFEDEYISLNDAAAKQLIGFEQDSQFKAAYKDTARDYTATGMITEKNDKYFSMVKTPEGAIWFGDIQRNQDLSSNNLQADFSGTRKYSGIVETIDNTKVNIFTPKDQQVEMAAFGNFDTLLGPGNYWDFKFNRPDEMIHILGGNLRPPAKDREKPVWKDIAGGIKTTDHVQTRITGTFDGITIDHNQPFEQMLAGGSGLAMEKEGLRFDGKIGQADYDLDIRDSYTLVKESTGQIIPEFDRIDADLGKLESPQGGQAKIRDIRMDQDSNVFLQFSDSNDKLARHELVTQGTSDTDSVWSTSSFALDDADNIHMDYNQRGLMGRRMHLDARLSLNSLTEPYINSVKLTQPEAFDGTALMDGVPGTFISQQVDGKGVKLAGIFEQFGLVNAKTIGETGPFDHNEIGLRKLNGKDFAGGVLYGPQDTSPLVFGGTGISTIPKLFVNVDNHLGDPASLKRHNEDLNKLNTDPEIIAHLNELSDLIAREHDQKRIDDLISQNLDRVLLRNKVSTHLPMLAFEDSYRVGISLLKLNAKNIDQDSGYFVINPASVAQETGKPYSIVGRLFAGHGDLIRPGPLGDPYMVSSNLGNTELYSLLYAKREHGEFDLYLNQSKTPQTPQPGIQHKTLKGDDVFLDRQFKPEFKAKGAIVTLDLQAKATPEPEEIHVASPIGGLDLRQDLALGNFLSSRSLGSFLAHPETRYEQHRRRLLSNQIKLGKNAFDGTIDAEELTKDNFKSVIQMDNFTETDIVQHMLDVGTNSVTVKNTEGDQTVFSTFADLKSHGIQRINGGNIETHFFAQNNLLPFVKTQGRGAQHFELVSGELAGQLFAPVANAEGVNFLDQGNYWVNFKQSLETRPQGQWRLADKSFLPSLSFSEAELDKAATASYAVERYEGVDLSHTLFPNYADLPERRQQKLRARAETNLERELGFDQDLITNANAAIPKINLALYQNFELDRTGRWKPRREPITGQGHWYEDKLTDFLEVTKGVFSIEDKKGISNTPPEEFTLGFERYVPYWNADGTKLMRDHLSGKINDPREVQNRQWLNWLSLDSLWANQRNSLLVSQQSFKSDFDNLRFTQPIGVGVFKSQAAISPEVQLKALGAVQKQLTRSALATKRLDFANNLTSTELSRSFGIASDELTRSSNYLRAAVLGFQGHHFWVNRDARHNGPVHMQNEGGVINKISAPLTAVGGLGHPGSWKPLSILGLGGQREFYEVSADELNKIGNGSRVLIYALRDASVYRNNPEMSEGSYAKLTDSLQRYQSILHPLSMNSLDESLNKYASTRAWSSGFYKLSLAATIAAVGGYAVEGKTLLAHYGGEAALAAKATVGAKALKLGSLFGVLGTGREALNIVLTDEIKLKDLGKRETWRKHKLSERLGLAALNSTSTGIAVGGTLATAGGLANASSFSLNVPNALSLSSNWSYLTWPALYAGGKGSYRWAADGVRPWSREGVKGMAKDSVDAAALRLAFGVGLGEHWYSRLGSYAAYSAIGAGKTAFNNTVFEGEDFYTRKNFKEMGQSAFNYALLRGLVAPLAKSPTYGTSVKERLAHSFDKSGWLTKGSIENLSLMGARRFVLIDPIYSGINTGIDSIWERKRLGIAHPFGKPKEYTLGEAQRLAIAETSSLDDLSNPKRRVMRAKGIKETLAYLGYGAIANGPYRGAWLGPALYFGQPFADTATTEWGRRVAGKGLTGGIWETIRPHAGRKIANIKSGGWFGKLGKTAWGIANTADHALLIGSYTSLVKQGLERFGGWDEKDAEILGFLALLRLPTGGTFDRWEYENRGRLDDGPNLGPLQGLDGKPVFSGSYGKSGILRTMLSKIWPSKGFKLTGYNGQPLYNPKGSSNAVLPSGSSKSGTSYKYDPFSDSLVPRTPKSSGSNSARNSGQYPQTNLFSSQPKGPAGKTSGINNAARFSTFAGRVPTKAEALLELSALLNVFPMEAVPGAEKAFSSPNSARAQTATIAPMSPATIYDSPFATDIYWQSPGKAAPYASSAPAQAPAYLPFTYIPVTNSPIDGLQSNQESVDPKLYTSLSQLTNSLLGKELASSSDLPDPFTITSLPNPGPEMPLAAPFTTTSFTGHTVAVPLPVVPPAMPLPKPNQKPNQIGLPLKSYAESGQFFQGLLGFTDTSKPKASLQSHQTANLPNQVVNQPVAEVNIAPVKEFSNPELGPRTYSAPTEALNIAAASYPEPTIQTEDASAYLNRRDQEIAQQHRQALTEQFNLAKAEAVQIKTGISAKLSEFTNNLTDDLQDYTQQYAWVVPAAIEAKHEIDGQSFTLPEVKSLSAPTETLKIAELSYPEPTVQTEDTTAYLNRRDQEIAQQHRQALTKQFNLAKAEAVQIKTAVSTKLSDFANDLTNDIQDYTQQYAWVIPAAIEAKHEIDGQSFTLP